MDWRKSTGFPGVSELDREPFETGAIDEVTDVFRCFQATQCPFDLDLPDRSGADHNGICAVLEDLAGFAFKPAGGGPEQDMGVE